MQIEINFSTRCRWVVFLLALYQLSPSLAFTQRSVSYAQTPGLATQWDAQLRRWEYLNTVTSKALTRLFRSGPSHEVLRAIAQRRWDQGLSLSLKASRDRRTSVRRMAYFALSQLVNIPLQSWMTPLLSNAKSHRKDRSYLARILGISAHPEASDFVAPLIGEHENFEVFKEALISAWRWAHRGYLINLTIAQAQLIISPRHPRMLRLFGVDLAATYLKHSSSVSGLNPKVTQVLRQHLHQLAQGKDLELAQLALQAIDAQVILSDVIKWWGVHQLQDLNTISSSLAQAQSFATRRLISAPILGRDSSAALTPLIFERYFNRLQYHQLRMFNRAKLNRPNRSKPRKHSGVEVLFNTNFSAHLRLLDGLLNLRRPSADLVRVARRGIRMTREWEAQIASLRRDDPLHLLPLHMLGVSELIRLRCYLSALVDLKSRRIRSLKSCSDREEWYPLIVKLALKITLNAPDHHRVKDWEKLIKHIPSSADRARANLIRGFKTVKLLGRRRNQIQNLLKDALKMRGESALAALDVITHHKLVSMSPDVIRSLRAIQRDQKSLHLTMRRSIVRTLGTLGQRENYIHILPYLTSPHSPLRIAAQVAMTQLKVQDPQSAGSISKVKRPSTRADPQWGKPAPWSEIIFTFAYGEVKFTLLKESFHALRSIGILTQAHPHPQEDHVSHGFIDGAGLEHISLYLPQFKYQNQTPQSEPVLTKPTYLIGERWVLVWSGPEWDEIEPRLILTRGPLKPPLDRHGIIGELSQGREILSRLGIGDQLLKVQLR